MVKKSAVEEDVEMHYAATVISSLYLLRLIDCTIRVFHKDI